MDNFREEVTESIDVAKILLENVAGNALLKGLPLVIWRKPQDDSFKLTISLQPGTFIKDIQLEKMDPGFLFCPFESNERHYSHFLKNDILLEFKDNTCRKLGLSANITPDNISFLFENTMEENPAFYQQNDITPSSVSEFESDYQELVKKSIEYIEKGIFNKVVPSRFKKIILPRNFQPLDFFKKLESSYPNAFVYLISIPDSGTWIGATPENLISIEENKIFKTTALAGTQRYEEKMNLRDAAWRQKEIEEQAIVSRYIINCFKKIRLREFEEIGPKTVKAGNLIHLKTEFIVNMADVNFPQLGTVMLDLLHPTSAVCGMPKEPSLDFIHKNEGFDRSYFSGFLGPVNTNDQTNLFVNLRCMKLTGTDAAKIFAGAGVTIDSNPEKEWQETEMKMDTLLKLL